MGKYKAQRKRLIAQDKPTKVTIPPIRCASVAQATTRRDLDSKLALPVIDRPIDKPCLLPELTTLELRKRHNALFANQPRLLKPVKVKVDVAAYCRKRNGESITSGKRFWHYGYTFKVSKHSAKTVRNPHGNSAESSMPDSVTWSAQADLYGQTAKVDDCATAYIALNKLNDLSRVADKESAILTERIIGLQKWSSDQCNHTADCYCDDCYRRKFYVRTGVKRSDTIESKSRAQLIARIQKLESEVSE